MAVITSITDVITRIIGKIDSVTVPKKLEDSKVLFIRDIMVASAAMVPKVRESNDVIRSLYSIRATKTSRFSERVSNSEVFLGVSVLRDSQ